VFGIGVFYLYRIVKSSETRLGPHRELRWILVTAAVGSFVLLVNSDIHQGWGLQRQWINGLAASVRVASARLLEGLFKLSAASARLFLLGESSYILYLIHPYIVYGVLRLTVPAPSSLGATSAGLLIIGLLALCSFIAIAIHILFEKPVMAYCH